MYVCAMCVQCLWRAEEGADPQELELQKTVSCHVGAGYQT